MPILVVEDDDALREALVDTLALGGYEVVAVSNGEAALDFLRSTSGVGLVLSDVQMQPMNGDVLLGKIKALYPWVPVMLMTAYGVIDKAVAAMHAGACHYLPKPFESEQLLISVAKYLLPDCDSEMIAEDSATLRLLNVARRVAQSDASVMITGESGVGKEVLARFIHRNSNRAHRPFVAINCAAIPEQLLESTLFGHEKGAFTGAAVQHVGKFEQAQGGVLLLDEVTEMPLVLQAKLLRVLQEREVERVGGTKAIPIDIRVLATSNRNVPEEVVAGRFREDLYYRLNVFPIHLPALRERIGDILPLARVMLARHACQQKRRIPVLTAEAEQCMLAYLWGGNIRELDNAIQRALILAPGDEITPEHLNLPGVSANIAISKVDSFDKMEPAPVTDIKELEKQHILEVLRAAGGVRKVAAEKLNMSERTLRHKLQQYRELDGNLHL